LGSEEGRQPAPLLETRHVFLDTQVYHGLKHNPANPAFRNLAEHVRERRIVLHTSDITLMEVQRQLKESVAARGRELATIEKELVRWRYAAPHSAPAKPPVFDAGMLGDDLFKAFRNAVVGGCGATVHQALQVPAEAVFATYFARLPPFESEGSKEFPDAFVLAVLELWCQQHDERLYVVTADGAMARGADKSDRLISAKSIQAILGMASAAIGGDAEANAERAINDPAFDSRLEEAIKSGIKDAVFVYDGDLPDGEAYEGELVNIISVSDWTVIGRAGARVSLMMKVDVTAQIEVQYEDRSEAMWDGEDGRWMGTGIGKTEVETEVALPVFMEIDTTTGRFTDFQVLDDEVAVSERYDDFR
jgi:hypothetical protein